MKSLTNHLMVAAVAVAAVAGVASAQTMKVEIPFAFHAAGKTMPAGTYSVAAVHGMTSLRTIRLANTELKEALLVQPLSPHYGPAGSDTETKLVFLCTSGDCSLAQIWSGASGAYDIHVDESARQYASLIAIDGKAE